MPLSALITAAGCTIVLNAGQFADGGFPAAWPTFEGETVICFEPGEYPSWGGWVVPGGTAETPVRVVALVADRPWKVPREDRVTFTGYTSLRNSHVRLENFAIDALGREVLTLDTGMPFDDPPTVNMEIDGLLSENGVRRYAVTLRADSALRNAVIRDAEFYPNTPELNPGGVAIFGSRVTVEDIEVYDRGSDCIQVGGNGALYTNILIDGMDCYQTGKRYFTDAAGGIRSCSEDGMDIKSGVHHSEFDGTNGNIARNIRIWGLRRAGACELGGGSGHGVLLHFGLNSHWTFENIDVLDSEICFNHLTKTNQPPDTNGTPSYITYKNVRCIEPYQDVSNHGWGLVTPPLSEVVGADVIRAPGRWITLGGDGRSVRCVNVIDSAPFAGQSVEDQRRTMYYGTARGAYLETKKGERVVWANAPLTDITITRKLLTGPETITVKRAAPSIDWRTLIWGDPCDPGTSLDIGANALPL